MFVKDFANQKPGIQNGNKNEYIDDHVVPDDLPELPYDEIMLDMDLISQCCPQMCCRSSEIKELPLNVLIKTVENWLEAISNDSVGKICECVTRSDSVFSGSASASDSGYSATTRPSSVASIGDSVTSGKTSFSYGDSLISSSSMDNTDCLPGRDSRSSSFGSARAKSVTFEDSMDEAVPKEYLELVTLHLPIILRFCLTCPCLDVREKCQYLLEAVRNRGLPVPVAIISGPSAFIPHDEVRFYFILQGVFYV